MSTIAMIPTKPGCRPNSDGILKTFSSFSFLFLLITPTNSDCNALILLKMHYFFKKTGSLLLYKR